MVNDLFESVAQRFARMLGRKQNVLRSWPAVTGDIFGTTQGSLSKYILVRQNDLPIAVEVYNGDVVPYIAGIRVVIGYTADRPRLLRVISVNDQRTDNADYGLVGPHGSSHGYLAHDAVYLSLRQITTLRVYASGGLEVTIQAGFIERNGVEVSIPDTTQDLTANVPTNGARYVLISLDETGAIVVTNGTIAESSAALTLAFIPQRPVGHFSLAAVRLIAGLTTIRESRTAIDIVDMRWPQNLDISGDDLASAILASQVFGFGA